MVRGSRGGRVISPGDMFRLVPVSWAHASKPGDRVFEYDLNADVAAALLDVSLHTLTAFVRRGRRRRDTGELVRLECWLPYGATSRRRYYSLVDLERFCLDAWAQPRKLRYEIIPAWYIEKHDRPDLADRTRPAIPVSTMVGDRILDPAQVRAIELGFPTGSYAEDNGDVYSEGGVWLNPPLTASEEIRALAARELEWMRPK